MNLFRRAAVMFVAAAILIVCSACKNTVQPPKEEPLKRPNESFLKYGETNETIVELNKVNHSIWVHTSYHEENGELIPLNGLLAVTDKGLVLIDTPWTEKQMESLDKLIKEAFNGRFKGAIITNADPVSIKAVSYLKKKNIPVQSLEKVAKEAEKNGLIMPGQINKGDTAGIEIDGDTFELYYPGEGSSPENTVVWMEKYKLLYAGGLVLEYGASSLGSTEEIDKSTWNSSIEAIQDRYQEIEIVIPRQGQWGDTSLIDYTRELLEE